MFENEFTLTGQIKFKEKKYTSNGNVILNAVLGRGNKEKGYENYKIRAFKDNAQELEFVEEGTVITIKGWISQDNWEKDGKKYSNVIFNIKFWEEYQSKE